jgi:predicted nucleic acid-binding protein
MLLLDTSFLIELETELARSQVGPARALLSAHRSEPVAISIVSVGEFAEGFAEPVDVEAFLSRFRVLARSRAIAYKTAAMQSALSARLGENDAWIAATALAYGATVVGREGAFRRVPRLKYLAI